MMAAKKERPAWMSSVMKLGWISFFADVSTEMAYPVIPLFIINTLKAPLAALGFIEGFAEFIVSFMKGWSGFHSDKVGKRAIFVQIGYSLSALGKPLLALAPVWPVALFARATDRFGKGLRTTARDTLIADDVPKSELGRAYGIHRGMDTAGAFTGVAIILIVLLILGKQIGDGLYRTIFVAAAVPGVVSALITLTLKDKNKPAKQVGETHSKTADASAGKWYAQVSPAYWRAVVLTTVFALANSSDMFLIYKSNSVFETHSSTSVWMTTAKVILAYLLYNFTYTVLSYPMGVLSDRIGKYKVLAAGWIIYSAVYLGFAFANTWLIWILFAVYGCYMGFTDGVSKALVASNAPAGIKGSALGFYYMCTGFAALAGNCLAGFLWDRSSPAATFVAGAGIALIAAVLIPATAKFEKQSLVHKDQTA